MREMNNLLELPVFQIVGGSEGEQKKFAQRLLRELEMYSIQAVILENNRCTLHHMYSLVKTNDLVLVIGKSNFQLQTILIDGNDGDSGGDLFQIVCPKNSFHQCIDELMHRLKFLLRKTPVWACILIGGKSSRMGVPKHLIKADNGRTWLENSLNKLYPLVDGVVIVGDGVVPEGLKKTARLPDIPGVVGPLTGILAASRWQPLVSWLLIACDMPLISKEAVSWLLSDRRPGDWGRVPCLDESGRSEPLFAFYDFRAGQLLEEQMYNRHLRISQIGSHVKIANPIVPDFLRHCWENINTPEQLKKIQ